MYAKKHKSALRGHGPMDGRREVGTFAPTRMSLTQRAEKSALVSPNPAGDHLFVHLPLPREFETRFELRDLSGRKVKEALISSGEQSAYLDVSALDPGLYFYTIHAKGLLPQSGKVTIIR